MKVYVEIFNRKTDKTVKRIECTSLPQAKALNADVLRNYDARLYDSTIASYRTAQDARNEY